MKLIVCVDKKGGIGKNGTMPWHNKTDLKHFKDTTFSHFCIFGRKTMEVLPKLKGRGLFTISSSFNSGSVQKIGNNKTSVIDLTKIQTVQNIAWMCGAEVFVCGGEKLYNYTLDEGLIDEIIITRLEEEYSCDTFFPLNKLSDFNLVDSKDLGVTVEYWRKI